MIDTYIAVRSSYNLLHINSSFILSAFISSELHIYKETWKIKIYYKTYLQLYKNYHCIRTDTDWSILADKNNRDTLLSANLLARLVDLYPGHYCGCHGKVLIIFPAEDTHRTVTDEKKKALAVRQSWLVHVFSLLLIPETRKLNLLYRAYQCTFSKPSILISRSSRNPEGRELS